MADELSIRMSGCSKASQLSVLLATAFTRALALETRLPTRLLEMDGMSGRKYRMLINNLIGSIPNPRYLEIGCWTGSTSCAALYGNQAKITCIDNWSEFGGPKQEFFHNIEMWRNTGTDFRLIDSDFRAINFNEQAVHNVYFYDGPHEFKDQFDGAIIPTPALDHEYVFIADDWNALEIRNGTLAGLKNLGYEQRYAIEIRTTQDDSHAENGRQFSDWHNGVYMCVLRKP